MPRPVRARGTKGRVRKSALIKTAGKAPYRFMVRPHIPDMKISLTLLGASKAEKYIKKLLKDNTTSTYKAVQASVRLIEREAEKIVSAGPMKAVLTGKMLKAIKSYMEKYTADLITGAAGVFGVDYAIYVHMGTRYMEARPFLLLAFLRKKQLVIRMIMNAYKKDYGKGLTK